MRISFLFLLTALACSPSRNSEDARLKSESPQYSCGEGELEVELYVSGVEKKLTLLRSGTTEEHKILREAFEVQSASPEWSCGSFDFGMVIRGYAEHVQVAYGPDGSTGLQFRYDADTPSPTFSWQKLESPNYTISYKSGSEADRDAMNSHMAHSVAAMKAEFSNHGPSEILESIESFDVYVHPAPNDLANEATATLKFQDAAGHHAILHFLAPSAHDPALRDNLPSYIRKTVIHEYGTMFLFHLVAKRAGWKDLYSAPGWFVQGYQEYLGLTLGDEHSRNVTLAKYLAMVKTDSSRIAPAAGGFDVTNDYYDGTVLLHFLHETYGKEKVQAILTSTATTFAAAVESEISPWNEVQDAFAQWLAN